MIGGWHFSKALFVLGMISAFIVIPTFLFKLGFSGNIYVDTFTNPFIAFGVIIFTGIVAKPLWLKPNALGVLFILGLMFIAYAYVFTIIGV